MQRGHLLPGRRIRRAHRHVRRRVSGDRPPGQIVGRHNYSGGSSWVAGTIDIEALRRFRANAQWDNWIKDLTTEQYQLIYEEPVYPKNLYLDRAPYQHDEYRREVIARQVDLMHKRDIWVPPERDEAG